MALMALFTVGITSLAPAQSEQAPQAAPESKTVEEEAAPAVEAEAPAEVKEAEPKEAVAPVQTVSQKLSPADRKKTLSEMEADEEKAEAKRK